MFVCRLNDLCCGRWRWVTCLASRYHIPVLVCDRKYFSLCSHGSFPPLYVRLFINLYLHICIYHYPLYLALYISKYWYICILARKYNPTYGNCMKDCGWRQRKERWDKDGSAGVFVDIGRARRHAPCPTAVSSSPFRAHVTAAGSSWHIWLMFSAQPVCQILFMIERKIL